MCKRSSSSKRRVCFIYWRICKYRRTSSRI
uniref:Uncharacterized protein n=1 Tax=Myoviridae sp. ctjhW4 TaxID=2825162 RepID=A0A8S5PT63_9CAUD|nr:MAG TPA: hypothetical protein [Myoviridae sp. ctjhW4]